MSNKKVVVLTGAGISAESGIPTFRASDGLWEGHDVVKVATIDGWYNDRKTVLQFYNERRKKALSSHPNPGHKALAQLEKYFDVTIITQNVDNLHERAGSSKVIHLHGELFKARSTVDETLVYDIEGWELGEGDLCERGSQLRPHIVWFGEMVPMMEVALEETLKADVFMVVGTSLAVYPAAGLLDYVDDHVPKFIVDPSKPPVAVRPNLFFYEEKASTGVDKVASKLIREYAQ